MDLLIMDCGADIKGETTTTGYKDKIELMAFSHGVSMQITGDQSNQKRTSGKPNHQDMSVTKYVDLSSCKLLAHCNAGTAIKDVKIYVLQNEEDKINAILTYEMKDVVISSISIGGGGGGKPTESVTLNYSQISWTYKPQMVNNQTKGQDAAKWNLATNKAE